VDTGDRVDDRDGRAHQEDHEGVRETTELEIPEPDVREIAATEPAPTDSDRVRVATAGETAAWTTGAYRALAEVTARETYDAQRAEEQRAAQLARWHDDPLTDTSRADEHGDEHGDQWAADDEALAYEPEPAAAP